LIDIAKHFPCELGLSLSAADKRFLRRAHRGEPTGESPQGRAHRGEPTGESPQGRAHRGESTGESPQGRAHRGEPKERLSRELAKPGIWKINDWWMAY